MIKLIKIKVEEKKELILRNTTTTTTMEIVAKKPQKIKLIDQPTIVDKKNYPFKCANNYILSGYRLHFNTPAKILKSYRC